MKRTGILILLLGLGFVANSQCSNYKDCLKAANGNIELLNKAIKLAKKEKVNAAEAYFERGKVNGKNVKWRDESKEAQAAISDLEEALKLDPYMASAGELLIDLYNKTRNFKAADKFFGGLVKSNKSNPVSFYLKGLYFEKKNWVNASTTDFLQAKKLLTGARSKVDSLTAALIKFRAIVAEKRNAGGGVYTAEDLNSIKAVQGSNDAIVLGELALAYYDNNDQENAKKYAFQARSHETGEWYNHKNSGGYFISGLSGFEAKSYFSSSGELKLAQNNRLFKHPAIGYYCAAAMHLYYSEKAPNLWKDKLPEMKKFYQIAIDLGPGTQYEYLVKSAKENLENISKPSGPGGSVEEKDVKEFFMNFNQLPNSYSLDYNTVQGRDITGLKLSKAHWGNFSGVFALGKFCDGSSEKALLIMLKVNRSHYESVRFLLVKMDEKGNKISSKLICETQKDAAGVSILGTFSYSKSSNSYSIKGENKFQNGHVNKTSSTVTCK